MNTAGFNLGHGRVVITKLCNVAIAALSNPVCAGSLLTLTTNALSNVVWSHSASSGTSIVVTPTVTTNYSVTGVGTPNNCTTTAVLQVSVMPLPFVAAYSYPLLICPGNTASLSAVGAVNYTWSSGPSGSLTTVNPQNSTSYTVTGVDANGCENTNTVMVNVSEGSVTVSSNTTVCEGTQVMLVASGAMSYTWSNGTALPGIQVTPNSTTIYSVMATDANFCQLTNTVQVTVNPKPNVNATAVPPEVCRGESVVLSAGGASTFTWTGSAPGSSVTVIPMVDVPHSYTVTGTGTNGCSRSFAVTVLVNKCAGIAESGVSLLKVYPNPGNGLFYLQSEGTINNVQVLDLSGRLLLSQDQNTSQLQLNLDSFANGIYYLKVSVNNESQMIRLIKN